MRVARKSGKVAWIALAQIVDREDSMAALEQLGHNPPADEARGTGYYDSHS
jgi:hypothetical protein